MLRNCILAGIALLLTLPSANAGVIVSTKLSLVIDVSGSISNSEYSRQMEGYAAAFRSDAVQDLIINANNGIAVNVVFFSNSAFNRRNEWVHLTDASSIDAYAGVLATINRPGNGGTNIASGINKARQLLTDVTYFESNRLVMDVSGDGQTSNANALSLARINAEAQGITINGLSIGSDGLRDYYANNVITSDGFVIKADNFNAFATAVQRKLELELAPPPQVPEPSSIAIFGLLAFGTAASRIRRDRKTI